MLKETLQPPLKTDPNIVVIMDATDTEFIALSSFIIRNLIYPRIDYLNADVLNLLAWAWHLEGYQLAKTIEEKRAMVKKAIELHRFKGTPWAVREALRGAGYLNARILELNRLKYNGRYKYNGQIKHCGGKPYMFRVILDLGENKGLTLEDIALIIQCINDYKNARSHLVDVQFISTLNSGIFITEMVHEILNQRYLYNGRYKHNGQIKYRGFFSTQQGGILDRFREQLKINSAIAPIHIEQNNIAAGVAIGESKSAIQIGSAQNEAIAAGETKSTDQVNSGNVNSGGGISESFTDEIHTIGTTAKFTGALTRDTFALGTEGCLIQIWDDGKINLLEEIALTNNQLYWESSQYSTGLYQVWVIKGTNYTSVNPVSYGDPAGTEIEPPNDHTGIDFDWLF